MKYPELFPVSSAFYIIWVSYSPRLCTIEHKLLPFLVANESFRIEENIDLTDNQLSSSIPIELFQIETLTTLWLSRNHLSGSLPQFITPLPLLRFGISENLITGIIPSFAPFVDIQNLHLASNSFSGEIISQFSELQNLVTIDIR